MPVLNVKSVKRMAEMSGADFPVWLEQRLRVVEDDEDAMRRVGIEATTELCRDLMAGGVDSFHFYTLNRSSATREIYSNLGFCVQPGRRDDPDRSAPAGAGFSLPWDAPDVGDPVVALTAGGRELGDTFVVESGGVSYLFSFSEAGLRSFYAVEERNASKGIADYRMLVRKLPDELFAERRTFAHDLFGAEEVQGYLGNLDWAIVRAIGDLGDAGSFDVFEFSRRLGHHLGLACWIGREAPIDDLIAEFEILDGAEAFVHPERSQGATKDEELAALRRVEGVIATLLARPDREPSFLDDIAVRWADVADPAPGIAGDVVLLHIATMTNLFAAIVVVDRGGDAAPVRRAA